MAHEGPGCCRRGLHQVTTLSDCEALANLSLHVLFCAQFSHHVGHSAEGRNAYSALAQTCRLPVAS